MALCVVRVELNFKLESNLQLHEKNLYTKEYEKCVHLYHYSDILSLRISSEIIVFMLYHTDTIQFDTVLIKY